MAYFSLESSNHLHIMKKIILSFLALASLAFGQIGPGQPQPATTAQVSAGTDKVHYVTPYDLVNSTLGNVAVGVTPGGGGTVTSVAVGNGLTASPSPVVGSGTISQDFSFSGTYTGSNAFTGANVFQATTTLIPLSIYGYANYQSAVIHGAATASQSFGLQIISGSNASDYGILISDKDSTGMFRVDGAGQVHMLKYYTSVGALVTDASGNVTIGLGNVTNDAQTKAAVVPNTAPSAGQLLVGNAGGTAYAPVSLTGPVSVSSAGLTAVGVLNQSTSGSAGSLKSPATTGVTTITGPAAAATRAKTVRDADDTILELGGSYTPSGTWVWTSATVTWPTFNQSTSGTASNVSGTPALPNGTTATTQARSDTSTKLATTAFVSPAPVNLGNLTGTINIDWSAGQMFYGVLTGSTTFTFSNAYAGGWIFVQVNQTGTNSYTVTWPAMKWTAATAPTMTAGAAANDDTVVVYLNSVYDASTVQNLK
jgi:hypothetical protein